MASEVGWLSATVGNSGLVISTFPETVPKHVAAGSLPDSNYDWSHRAVTQTLASAAYWVRQTLMNAIFITALKKQNKNPLAIVYSHHYCSTCACSLFIRNRSDRNRLTGPVLMPNWNLFSDTKHRFAECGFSSKFVVLYLWFTFLPKACYCSISGLYIMDAVWVSQGGVGL